MNTEYFKNILKDLCHCYDVAEIEVVFDKSLLTNKEAGGQYNFTINKIVIDEDLIDDHMEILFHEFRHYWQHCYYCDVFLWWTCCSGGLYRKYYDTVFCSIEEDARIFGETYGAQDREDLLQSYDVERLSLMRDDPGILRLTLQALGVEKMM